MPREKRLHPAAEWTQLSTTAADWKAADPGLLAAMLGQLHLIRAFEETVLELAADGLVHGPAHSSIGQEGGAVGSIVSLRSTDAVNGSHRGHHQFLAKAITHVTKGVLDPADLVTPEVATVLQRTLAEILGLAQGFCSGRGGSMHLQWFEAGALGTNAIVGGGVPMAAGNAWAQKHSGTDDLTVTYFGDGATNIGSVLESLNLTSAWDLPLCFFIENNLYAVSTTVAEATGEPRLSGRALGFGIPAWRVDGMDPLAVHLAMERAQQRLRAGQGPVVVEALVYRFFHQNGPFPGSAFGYRTKEEEAAWRARDPLDRVAAEMIKLGLIDEAGVASVREQAQQAMRVAVAELIEPDPDGRPGARRIRPGLWPDPAFVDVGIRGDLSELAGARTVERQDFTGELKPGKLIDAVARVMDRRMGEDPRIVVLGEDVHRLAGGTNGATKGLAAKYPGRVLGTPISENAFAGLGGGLALDGRFRPVVEFMYPDFMWVAADQVFNQIGKARHMFGGRNPVPLVLRTKVAMGSGYGSQHLMDPTGIFATSPGWRIMAASTPYDYIGLMNAALAIDDPVVMIEHVDLYGSQGEIPVGDLDYQIPFGTAAVRREGRDVTVLTYLSMVEHARQAIEQTGVDAELIDLRFLDRASLDWRTVGASIKKTNAVLIVEQGAQGTSYGGWLADEIQRRFFDWLDQPVQRVTGSEASPSISKVLERAAIARTEEVAAGLERVRAGLREGELMASVVRMPSVLAGATEAAIVTWLVAPGDRVSVGDPLAEIETEKAVVEYGAEEAGVVGRIVLAAGEPGAIGAPIVVLVKDGETDADIDAALGGEVAAAAPAGAPAGPVAPAAHRSYESEPVQAAIPATRIFASPIVRKIAREQGIDLTTLAGTGPNGRIVRRDLERLSAQSQAAAGEARDGTQPAADARLIPHTPIRRAIARRVTQSKATTPHFYLTTECVVDDLLGLRGQINETAPVKISVNDFVIMAVAAAFGDVPEANVTWSDEGLVVPGSVDVSIAVATDGGLVTPVLRGVETKRLSVIAAEAQSLAQRARDRRLLQHELEGGTFSISNLGMYGTLEFSAIINPPQSGILAVGAARPQPVVVGGAVAVATVMRCTLSVDHRAIDGALAARWLAAFTTRIQHPLGLLV